MRARWWVALYPAGFGAAYVLLSFATFTTPTLDLVRPLAIVLIGTPLLVLLAALPLRSLERASLAVSVVIVVLSAPFLLVAVAAAGAVVVGWQLIRRRWTLSSLRRTRARQAARVVALFSMAFVAVAIATASPFIVRGWYTSEPPAATVDIAPAPNIYLVLLDGYPRADTLASLYNYDDTWFDDALAQLGFTVAANSRSNYPQTPLTLTSMLNGQYLQDIDGLSPPPQDANEQYRRMMGALNDSAMATILRRHGYEIEDVPSAFHSDALTTANRYFDSGQLTAFEYSLLDHSQLRALAQVFPDFLMSQQRDRFRATLQRLTEEASADHDRPFFLFAHSLSPPHAPLLYGRDGVHMPLPDCIPDCSLWEFPEEAWAHLADQVDYTNHEVLATVQEIVNRDPTAVVILFSDHGSRRSPADLDEFFHNFFAARTPGMDLYPADVSPVNYLRLLVGELTGESLPPQPYRAWFFADERRPLELTPFEPTP